MHFLYLNIPWLIDEVDYNCSSRKLDEWKARGSVNKFQGVYFLTTGIIYVTIYIFSMAGMRRGRLLHIPCYRLMFFMGFIDIMDVIGGSIVVFYLHFTGGVFCSNAPLGQLLGHLCWSLWIGSTIICMALALNRLVEMVPSMEPLRFPFRGRSIYIWMATCVAIMVLRPFVTRPMPYNSVLASFIAAPAISDDLYCEIDYYTPLLLPIHNISFIFVLVALYTVLCYSVFKMSRVASEKIDKVQLQLFLQALVICTSSTTASILYVVVQFIRVPKSVIILTNAIWQLSHPLCHKSVLKMAIKLANFNNECNILHRSSSMKWPISGIHVVVYILLNKRIRREALRLFSLNGRLMSVGPMTTASIIPNQSKGRPKMRAADVPVMHLLYLNIPWLIDEKEYNCSSRTLNEWKARGSVNKFQGVYFLSTGIIYVVVYILSMIGMARGRLLHIPCYRLMFFMGFIDIMDVIGGSIAVSYLHFTGGVFCSNVPLGQFLGHLCWSLWIGSTTICMALALNRLVEMIPYMEPLRFLFRGRSIYIWMVTCVAIMVLRPFVTRPVPYNSVVAAFIGAPAISDDLYWLKPYVRGTFEKDWDSTVLVMPAFNANANLLRVKKSTPSRASSNGTSLMEIDYYTPLLLPIHNISFIFVLVALYIVLCYNVFKMSRVANGKIEKVQLQLFLQALVICTSTTTASILYVVVQFIPVPKFVIILTNAVWQLSHGIHGVVYILLNKRIRREVLRLFSLNGRLVNVGPMTTASIIPNQSKGSHTSRN